MCPGQDIADAELLVMCGNLLRFFVLSPKLDAKGDPIWPDPEKWGSAVIGSPLPFDCEIKVRDAGKLESIESMYRAAFGNDSSRSA